MKRKILIVLLSAICWGGSAQEDSSSHTTNHRSKKQRLDFATMYFEAGATFSPSFTGKRLLNNAIDNFENPAAAVQYLNWGGFHFWGHGEFYVTFPMNYFPFQKNEETSAELWHYVTTGYRFLPWAYQEKKLRPYFGVSWSALDFKQKIKPDANSPMLSKDFMLVPEAGLLFGYRSFALRVGLYYYHDNKWNYPLSRTVKAEVKTPPLALQVGLVYTMETSKNTEQDTKDKWNSYPKVSKQSFGSTKFGDIFVGIGPSLSYCLVKSEYNQKNLPYLKNRLTSSNYFDIALGYHFEKLGLFTALSFRNPKFETEGYGAKQTIRKTSLALEVNKFLVDYTGFTPYVGINVAYDRLKYSENIDGIKKDLVLDRNIEPGITVGWDIQPGKNTEAIQLRTNLRWYPMTNFKVDGLNFNFSQLEYNLIQVVFYPGRLDTKKLLDKL